jgi:hypothetical protein
LVRSDIIVRSCSATAARMCSVSRVACGLSTATNSTPESISAAMKAKLRESRSSFATTSLAFSFLQAARAARSCGRLSDRLPLAALRLDVLGFGPPVAAVQVIGDGRALRF